MVAGKRIRMYECSLACVRGYARMAAAAAAKASSCREGKVEMGERRWRLAVTQDVAGIVRCGGTGARVGDRFFRDGVAVRAVTGVSSETKRIDRRRRRARTHAHPAARTTVPAETPSTAYERSCVSRWTGGLPGTSTAGRGGGGGWAGSTPATRACASMADRQSGAGYSGGVGARRNRLLCRTGPTGCTPAARVTRNLPVFHCEFVRRTYRVVRALVRSVVVVVIIVRRRVVFRFFIFFI